MATVANNIERARNQERKRVLMRGTIFAPSGAAVVWIRDISTEGAWVAAQDRLPGNCDVIFKRGPLFVAAHITRSDETGAGVKFYRALTDEQVASAALPLPNRDD